MQFNRKPEFRIDRANFNYSLPDHVEKCTLYATKYNRTATVLNSILITKKPITDDYLVDVDVFGMQGNEYRKIMPNIVKRNLCTFLLEDDICYPKIVKSSNFPPQGPTMCPIAAGNYILFEIL